MCCSDLEDVIVLEYSDLPVNRYCSKLGGLPYLLEGENIPCDGNEPLILLAQINFDELKGKTVGDLPDHGMLQFFIKCDDVYGCDFDFNVDNPSERTVRNYCAQGKIEGACLVGKSWNVPADAGLPRRGKASPVSL